MKYLIKENIISNEQSLNESKSTNKNYVLREVEGKDEDRKNVWRIKIFEKMFENFSQNKFDQICKYPI